MVVVGGSLDAGDGKGLRAHLTRLGTVVLDGSPDHVIAGLEQVLNAEQAQDD